MRRALKSWPLAVVVLLALAATAHAPVPAQASAKAVHAAKAKHRALKMIWGPNTLPDGVTSAFPTYKALGVDVLQVQLVWRYTAPTRPANPTDPNDPAYKWQANVDTAVAEAAKYGIKICLLVKQTPDWANDNRGAARVPDDDTDYTNFLQAAMKRYPNVRFWMIWGEPTRKENFQPMPVDKPTGPRRYARLLDKSYGVIKKVNRANKVIGGNTFTTGDVTPTNMVRWMRLPNGKLPRMDYWGHNPYASFSRFPDIRKKPYAYNVRDISDLDTFHGELAGAFTKQHRKIPPFWLSEFNISNTANRGFGDSFVSLAEQAKWCTAGFKIANKLPYVVGLGWFELLDENSTDKYALTTGLMTKTGQPKPVFDAYKRAP